jgi:hypothetical protein
VEFPTRAFFNDRGQLSNSVRLQHLADILRPRMLAVFDSNHSRPSSCITNSMGKHWLQSISVKKRWFSVRLLEPRMARVIESMLE